MNTKNLAIFTEDGEKSFCDVDEIQYATFGDWEFCGYNSDDMGLETRENEETEEIEYRSLCDDFDGWKTWEEIEDIETNWHCISWWNGNNWQRKLFEDYSENEFEIENLEDPKPAYYFRYNLYYINEDGSKEKPIFCTKSNMSGSLSPFYKEDNQTFQMENREKIDWPEVE